MRPSNGQSSRSQLCDRARQWASLRADGEISELENALLESHLGRCEACRDFAREAEGIASALRSVALERIPTPVQWDPVQLGLPRRRRVPLRVVQTAAAAALVVAAAALGSLLGVANRAADVSSRTALRHTAMVAMADSADNLRQLRRPALVAESTGTRAIPRNRLLPGETV